MTRATAGHGLPFGWAVLALFLFLLLPGHPLSYIGGLPWRPLALGCAVLLEIGYGEQDIATLRAAGDI